MSVSSTHKNPTGVPHLSSTRYGTKKNPYFAKTLCKCLDHVTQDHNLEAKSHGSTVSRPPGLRNLARIYDPRIFGVVFGETSLDNDHALSLFRRQWVAAVPFVILFQGHIHPHPTPTSINVWETWCGSWHHDPDQYCTGLKGETFPPKLKKTVPTLFSMIVFLYLCQIKTRVSGTNT